jgi:AcrR family transcriptional regulator
MSRSTARRLTASERLPLIEQAATRLFARRGFAATTVEDIARAAGMTKPMVYRHFESKQELCVALLERYRAELIEAPLAQFVPGRGDQRTRLASMIEAWLEHIERHPDAARLLFTPIGGDPEVERVQRELYARQRATQSALLREFVPGLEEAEAEPLGEAIRAGMAAVALWWLDHPEVLREVPARALLRLTEGIVVTLGRPGDGERG